MVAIKGKLNSVNTSVMDKVDTSKPDTVGFRKFKIYAENDKVKPPRMRDSLIAELKRSVPLNNGCKVTATNSKIKEGFKDLEKTKGKHDKSATLITRRKVLANISNVQGKASISNAVLHDGTKAMTAKIKNITYLKRTAKIKNITYLKRSSTGTGLKGASASLSKQLEGKSRDIPSQATGSHRTVVRVEKNGLKVSSSELRTTIQGRKSFNNVNRTSLIPRPQTRNSLPVLKRVNKVDLGDVEKEYAVGKSKEKYGFSVKPKVGTKILPPGSSSWNNLSTNQARDGCVKKALAGQLKVDSRGASRKLMKSSVNSEVIVSDPQTTLEKTGIATLSMRMDKMCTSLVSAQQQQLVVPGKLPASDELTSDCDSNLVRTASDVVSAKMSGRRKSYTSVLMARSKLLKDQVKITEQDFLPNIDDDCNHLEVAEYVDEIYQYYWVMEAHHQPLQNFMNMQKEITPQMRGILVNWLIEVHLKFELMQETLYLMVTLLDKYLSLVSINKNELQLVGLTSLLLASKYEDFWHPRISDLIGISAESYTRDQMLRMESAFLRKLKFRLNAPTPYVFMLRFLKAAQSDKKFENLAYYLIELSLVEYEAVNFKHSLLCASAIYLARCTLQMSPAWTPLLAKHAHYEESEIRDCAQNLLRFHKAARQGLLKVTYEKFMRPDYGKVASIKPLDKLPL